MEAVAVGDLLTAEVFEGGGEGELIATQLVQRRGGVASVRYLLTATLLQLLDIGTLLLLVVPLALEGG